MKRSLNKTTLYKLFVILFTVSVSLTVLPYNGTIVYITIGGLQSDIISIIDDNNIFEISKIINKEKIRHKKKIVDRKEISLILILFELLILRFMLKFYDSLNLFADWYTPIQLRVRMDN